MAHSLLMRRGTSRSSEITSDWDTLLTSRTEKRARLPPQSERLIFQKLQLKDQLHPFAGRRPLDLELLLDFAIQIADALARHGRPMWPRHPAEARLAEIPHYLSACCTIRFSGNDRCRLKPYSRPRFRWQASRVFKAC